MVAVSCSLSKGFSSATTPAMQYHLSIRIQPRDLGARQGYAIAAAAASASAAAATDPRLYQELEIRSLLTENDSTGAGVQQSMANLYLDRVD